MLDGILLRSCFTIFVGCSSISYCELPGISFFFHDFNEFALEHWDGMGKGYGKFIALVVCKIDFDESTGMEPLLTEFHALMIVPRPRALGQFLLILWSD